MALMNIGAGNSDDAFYRYKMPRLIAKIEGRGNGIKTNIVNMVDIAKALARPPAYTTKFFGIELGAQSKYEDKTMTSTVNGAHEQAKLMEILEKFIKTFVQCYACGNPETDVNISKTETITLQCKACGNVSNVDMRHKLTTFIIKNPPETKGGKSKSKADKQLRRAEKERLKAGEAIDAEMTKAKKEAKKSKDGKEDKNKKKKKSKKGEKEEEAVDDETPPPEEEEGDDSVQWMTDTSEAAVRARIAQQLTAVTSNMVNVGNGDLDLEDENGEKKAKKSSKKGSEKPATVSEEGEEDEDDDDGASTPGKKVSRNGDDKKSSSSSSSSSDEEEANGNGNGHAAEHEEEDEDEEAEAENGAADLSLCGLKLTESKLEDARTFLEGPDGKKAGGFAKFIAELDLTSAQEQLDVAFSALFIASDVSSFPLPKLLKPMQKRSKFLAALVAGDDELERQMALLRCAERYLRTSADIVKEIALVLKYLYDGELVEEEVIYSWYDGPGASDPLPGLAEVMAANSDSLQDPSVLRKFSKPVVEWLKTADSDSD